MTSGDPVPGDTPAPDLELPVEEPPRLRFRGSTSAWIAKIVLLGMADAVAVTGLITAIDKEAWGYAALLIVTLIALNVVYLPRRLVPLKYLVPGVFFLAVFGIYPVLYTAYTSTTDYGTGHILSKAQAIERIQRQSVSPVEGATRYEVTALQDGDGAFAGFALYDPEGAQLFLGTQTELTELDLDDAVLVLRATTGRQFVESVGEYTGVNPGDARDLPGYPAEPDDYVMPGETEDAPIAIDGTQAVESRTTRIYDPAEGTITDSATGVVYREQDGYFVDQDGNRANPGFETKVGFANYREVLTDSEFRVPFLRVFAWNLAFAVLSVVTTFALGLFLAVVFNEVRMKGRRIYRSLIIIPYALPGFMTALVWAGMFNETYGINRWTIDIPWQSSVFWSMASLILVNLWLGYPYMFLVNTGALQSIPTDLKEAALVDGANGLTAFRKITFPLLLVSVSPLLVASFAFNFNNFTIVYLVTGGTPRDSGESAGKTDILLSWVYRVALDTEPKRQALGASLSVLIFGIVAVISAAGFKYTKTFEEAK